jgi:dihydropteroate synthase
MATTSGEFVLSRDILDPWLQDPYRPPLVMGVVNVTPDSFSDGGQFLDVHAAVDHAAQLLGDGADLLDLGAESTRPGAAGVPADEQLRRLLPVLEGIRRALPPVAISIDTTSGSVSDAALKSGADLINDISAGRFDPEQLPPAPPHRAPGKLIHMQGTPATMQQNPTYSDVAAEVRTFLADRLRAAVDAGIPPHRVLLDPGIGFGKTLQHNLTLLRHTRDLATAIAPHPLVIGTSRKGFIGTVTGEPVESRRLFGTAATVAHSVANRAAVVRVHDVKEMAQVVRMTRAITHGVPGGTT